MNQLSPFNALNEIHRELSRVFDHPIYREPSTLTAPENSWMPHVDITEDESSFTVIADIPGVNPDEVEVTLHNNVLTIRGERDSELSREKENFKRRERFRGTFQRQFSLPELTDEDAISAKANHGVLEITIPKAKKASPVSITVNGE